MTNPNFQVRPIEPRDEAEWRHLWAGYQAFYKNELTEHVTATTWHRLIGDEAAMFGFVACGADDRAVGLVHCVEHLKTSSDKPICYLEDLFVDPAVRGNGAGQALIEAVGEAARERGCFKVYWMTQSDNKIARGLYDKIGSLTEFIRYDMMPE